MMEQFTSGSEITETETEALTLTTDNLGIKEGVTVGMTVSAVALLTSILLINIISWLRR